MFNLGARLEQIQNAAKNAVNYRGNKDFLEATCAAIALVAWADGSASDQEVQTAIETASGNRSMSAAGFTDNDIARQLDKFMPMGKTFTGKLQLNKELKEVKEKDTTGELGQTVVAIALDVAAADGDIGEKELAEVKRIAGILSVKLSDFGLE